MIYHDDAVLEFPQSGERLEGVQNSRDWRRQYPAKLEFHLRRINHRGDLVVTEYMISHNGAPWLFTVSIMEFEDDRVAHERPTSRRAGSLRRGAPRGGPSGLVGGPAMDE